LSEYCIPLAKVDGYLVALTGTKAQNELVEAKNAIEVLGGRVEEVKKLTLPDTDDERTLIVVKKVKATAKKYPRQAGTPNKKPL
jgi:16S rRNA (guanine527-N7)-methyltransferase